MQATRPAANVDDNRQKKLHNLIQPLRQLDNHTNLFYLAADYAALFAVLAGTITFCHLHAEWGIHWAFTIPVVAAAVVLIGALQHRLAGLVHEGAHYMLFKNRVLNELVSDVFCAFPIITTTHQYRLTHLGHHQYVNDWERDPELLNLGKIRMMDSFPMQPKEFVRHFLARIFWPPSLIAYLLRVMTTASMGVIDHPYGKQHPKLPPRAFGFRFTTLLGVAYIVAMVIVGGLASYFGTVWHVAASLAACWAIGGAVAMALPAYWYFQSPFKEPYSNKLTSVLRLGWFTALEMLIAGSKAVTGYEWGIYFYLLWLLPLFTTFPYFMLLRDIFQHANADDGRLTNSRAVKVSPFLQWAMFIYGQGLHVTHHLYAAIPHYNLRKLHELLKQEDEEYAATVVECDGIFRNRSGRLTLIDVMHVPASAKREHHRPHVDDEIAAAQN